MIEVQNIDSYDSAIAAINRITEDGEGASMTNIQDSSMVGMSHFYKFLSLYAQKRLIRVEQDFINNEFEYIWDNNDTESEFKWENAVIENPILTRKEMKKNMQEVNSTNSTNMYKNAYMYDQFKEEYVAAIKFL